MVSVKHFLFAALLAAAACAPMPSEPPVSTAQAQVARLWTADTRAVLTGDAARSLARQCSRIAPGPVESVWTPTPAQLDALEGELILLVSRELEAADIPPSPGDYHRQYAGFVIGGRQVIYVNGIHESAASDERDAREAVHRPGYSWRTHAVQICDGGPIAFGVEYNPVTLEFTNFSFNGTVHGPFPPRE